MLHLLKKELDLDASPVLYDRPFSEASLAADWQVYGGQWWLEGDWLTGKNPGNFPGMIVSRAGFPGDVLLDFEARTVPPCTHDINWMWRGSWNEAANTRDVAYVAGLQGWWTGKVGFEKSPDYRLNVATPLFAFEPGRTYHIQSGSIGGHVFVVVDGRLVLEVTDPDPIDAVRRNRIGFEAYCSHIQVRRLRVRQPAWRAVESSYTPEFD